MKKTLTICSLVVALFLTGCSSTINQEENNTNTTAQTTQKTESETKAEKVSEKLITYTDVLGDPKILYLATVKNTDTRPLEFANVTIDVNDSNQNLIKNLDMGSIYPRFIMPGEYGYICEEVAQLDTNINLDEVSSAEMHFGTRTANYQKPDVEVTQLNIKNTGYDWNVLGKIKANSDYTNLWIAIPIKDSNGELQSVALESFDEISAGSEMGFECSLLEYDPETDFTNSTLEAIPYIW